jgi:hypothetical protein
MGASSLWRNFTTPAEGGLPDIQHGQLPRHDSCDTGSQFQLQATTLHTISALTCIFPHSHPAAYVVHAANTIRGCPTFLCPAKLGADELVPAPGRQPRPQDLLLSGLWSPSSPACHENCVMWPVRCCLSCAPRLPPWQARWHLTHCAGHLPLFLCMQSRLHGGTLQDLSTHAHVPGWGYLLTPHSEALIPTLYLATWYCS